MLTQQRLKELLHYDPENGVFTWKVGRGNMKPGSLAGVLSSHGYRVISIENKPQYAHRIAWLYMNGEWPTHQIDHIDGNRSNNAFANLRDVPRAVNLQNMRRAMPFGSTGLLGAHKARNGRFTSCISADGTTKNLGAFKTPEEAHAAYLSAKRELHVGCTI
jgi:hypothetical protein